MKYYYYYGVTTAATPSSHKINMVVTRGATNRGGTNSGASCAPGFYLLGNKSALVPEDTYPEPERPEESQAETRDDDVVDERHDEDSDVEFGAMEEEEVAVFDDEEEDEEFTIPTERKAFNQKESATKRGRKGESTLIPPPQKKTKRPKITAKEQNKIDEWLQVHVHTNLSKPYRLDDFANVLQSSMTSSEANPWHTQVNPILICTAVSELGLYDWISTSCGIQPTHVEAQRLEDNLWKIPRIENFPGYMKKFLIGAHEKLVAYIEKRNSEIEERNLVHGLRVPLFPPFISYEQLLGVCNRLRKKLHDLMWSWPVNEKCDVRMEIIHWMLETLVPIKTAGEFEFVIQEKIREGTREKMKSLGQQTIPDHFLPLTSVVKVKKAAAIKKKEAAKKKTQIQSKVDHLLSKPEATKNRTSGAVRSAQNTTVIGGGIRGSNAGIDTPKREERKENRRSARIVNKQQVKETVLRSARIVNKQVKETVRTRKLSQEEITVQVINEKGDEGLLALLNLWKSNCVRMERMDMFTYAMRGIQGALGLESIESIYRAHHFSDEENSKINSDEFLPPVPIPREKKNQAVEWQPPGELFEQVAYDLFQMMHVFICSTVVHGVGPTRWFWEANLLNGMSKTKKLTRNAREFAMLVCLILSAATPDDHCILATIKLWEAGLLEPRKMKEATLKSIKACIGFAGIGNKRAEFLKELAAGLMEKHNGVVPADVDELQSFKGIGRKTAVLAMNEIFGIPSGIGVDTHVIEMSRALGFLVEPPKVKLQALHVEHSLLTWVTQEHCRNFNPIMGGMAQLFTQQIATVKDKVKYTRAELLVLSAADHVHKPYHIELLWFAIARTRHHYRAIKK